MSSSYFDDVMETKRPQDVGDNYSIRSSEKYTTIPENTKSKRWDYALEEDGDGGRILSFLMEDGTLNFKINQPGENKEISAIRLPDSERDDFATRGNAVRGKMQLHKSGPGIIHGTIQNQGKIMTFLLEKNKDNEEWTIRSTKSPDSNVVELIRAVTPNKIAKVLRGPESSNADILTTPLTADYPQAMGLSALIGAGLLGSYHVGRKVLDKIMGREVRSTPLWQDLLLGAGAGAIGAGAFKMFGETDKELGRRAPRYNHRRPASVPLVFASKKVETPLVVDPSMVQPYQKKASMQKEANSIDISRIKNLLSFDNSLTSADRKILMSQLMQAEKIAVNGKIDIGRIRNAGLGALAGYILAKAMGFGIPTQIGAAAFGAFAAGGSTGNNSRKWDTRGFYHY
jgi:hypothetical protein